MPKTIALQAFRRHLSQVMGEVTYGGETYIIESYRRPAAVLLNIDGYRRLQATPLGERVTPARIISPRLANPAQAKDFELEVMVEGTHA